MKKNISINLFGSLYAIDEDAYKLLEQYLDNTKNYFSKRDGGDEIADDIEHRVAELFEELKANGKEAVSIEDVQSIITRIGNPEELDDEGGMTDEKTNNTESSFDNTNEKKFMNGRRLYRNPDNQVVGGVLSGLCTYFGGNDPLPWRLIFFILTLASLSTFCIIYFILWALIPMAVTAEDKLRMQGKPVNIDTLNEQIIVDAENTSKNKVKGILNTLVTIISFCFKLFLSFIIIMIIISLLGTMIALATGFFTPLSIAGFDNVAQELTSEILSANPSAVYFPWISVISALLFFGIILYSLVHSIIKRNTNEHISNASRISMVIFSVVLCIVSIVFGLMTYKISSDGIERYERKTNTINGIYLSGSQHSILASNGWELNTLENAKDPIYKLVLSFYDDDYRDRVLMFKRDNTAKPLRVNVKKSEQYPEGYYHIEAIVSAKCNGAYVYAKNDSTMMGSVMIPVDDTNNKGNMNHMSREELSKTSFFDYDLTDDIWEDDNFIRTTSYWSFVRTASFHHKGGTLQYGVTNMNDVIGLDKNGTPAWNFSLRKIAVVAD